MESLASFLLTALALAGSPGPNTLSCAAVGAAYGTAVGLRYIAGLTAGMGLVIAIVGSGVAGLLLAVPGAAPVITILAALYFAYLAYRIATAPPLQSESRPELAPRWYEGVLLSLMNPKAYAAMAAMFSGFVLVAADPVADGAWKVVLLIGVILTVNVAWLFAGRALTAWLKDARLSRTVNLAFAAMLIISVLATLAL